MTDQPYTKAVAELKVDGREEPYRAETDITPTGFPTDADKGMALTELEIKHGIIIKDAEYEQEPIFDPEEVHNGTLALGVILPNGKPEYDAPVPVKVLFNW